MDIEFFKATTAEEREVVNLFLDRHNSRGRGSTKGYMAYFAAKRGGRDGVVRVDDLIGAAKFCPLHTPQAAKFFGGDDWRHVYALQRLAAYRAPDNFLSQFLSWCLKEMGKDDRVRFVATYADTGTIDERNGRPHDGGCYRAAGAVYCGMTKGGRVEGFMRDGKRHSMRCGPRTHTVRELRAINEEARLAGKPEPVRLLRGGAMHRYCFPVGATRWERRRRRRFLEKRMAEFRFEAVWQPRLLARLLALLEWGRWKRWISTSLG